MVICMSNVYTNTIYKSPIQFLIDIRIREYDITKANISILRDANILSEQQYQYFLNCPKQEREIAIGKLQGRDSSVTVSLKNGIMSARKRFMELNHLNPNDILEINNDSITVIGDMPISNLSVSDRVSFRETGAYRSFYRLNRIEYFYDFDVITKKEVLDIKGIKDHSIFYHKSFMLDFFLELFYTAQIEGAETAIKLLSAFYPAYIDKRLAIGYYRELNDRSLFRLSNNFSEFSSWFSDNLTEYDKQYVDGSYNENVLRQLIRIYSSIYFKHN